MDDDELMSKAQSRAVDSMRIAFGMVTAYAYGTDFEAQMAAKAGLTAWVEEGIDQGPERLIDVFETLAHFSGLLVRELADANEISVADQLKALGIGTI